MFDTSGNTVKELVRQSLNQGHSVIASDSFKTISLRLQS